MTFKKSQTANTPRRRAFLIAALGLGAMTISACTRPDYGPQAKWQAISEYISGKSVVSGGSGYYFSKYGTIKWVISPGNAIAIGRWSRLRDEDVLCQNFTTYYREGDLVQSQKGEFCMTLYIQADGTAVARTYMDGLRTKVSHWPASVPGFALEESFNETREKLGVKY